MRSNDMSTTIAAMRKASGPASDDDLRQSLKRFGWVKEFPAIHDEHGTILVGNRRTRLAVELGIEPVISTLKLGRGDAADAERFKLAFVSNIGGKPLTTAERKVFAIYLHEERGWKQQRIAEALGVTQSAISQHLGKILGANKNHESSAKTKPPPSARAAEVAASRAEAAAVQERFWKLQENLRGGRRNLTPEQVDPGFNGTHQDFLEKHSRVPLQTASEKEQADQLDRADRFVAALRDFAAAPTVSEDDLSAWMEAYGSDRKKRRDKLMARLDAFECAVDAVRPLIERIRNRIR